MCIQVSSGSPLLTSLVDDESIVLGVEAGSGVYGDEDELVSSTVLSCNVPEVGVLLSLLSSDCVVCNG